MFGVVAYTSAQIFGRGEQPRGRTPPGQVLKIFKLFILLNFGKCEYKNICFQHQQNPDQARRAQEMIGRCQRQELATETDMTEFSQQKRPSAKTGKCLHACLMESIGLVTASKTFFFKCRNFICFFFSISRSAMVNYQ